MKFYYSCAKKLHNVDLAMLFIRLGLAGTIILHGIAKIIHGISKIQGSLVGLGFPEFIANGFAYFVYVGEILAPIMLILGIFSRLAGVFILGTSLFIFLVKGVAILGLDAHTGGLVYAEAYFYLITSLAIIFAGSGKYALRKD
ncbi:DoxX family protein [Campylobacter pinnipediorum subsp. caledonicus]|uniref:DoxX family protein n=1 Tax=Campylobacter pinnipediorum subsp. caledonicus TaxID=1874362 RepID=A0A1S6U8W3_9BACT|nr:DoxX family protein [Campylobacter pinnipediorum]AQW86473.1 DoxX family protein [Campylobacter pinnipediorum subsp. caledonicus]AQW88125.1 DoxX family protein [Campylobacter pinnipediorum subsp. caledonicus]OPA71566.1 hypothetical protein BB381_03475 [Campylobacter pinnipediorum subsp. caledonicus]